MNMEMNLKDHVKDFWWVWNIMPYKDCLFLKTTCKNIGGKCLYSKYYVWKKMVMDFFVNDASASQGFALVVPGDRFHVTSR